MSVAFKTWLRRFEGEVSPLGDFASAVAANPGFPRQARTWGAVLKYLRVEAPHVLGVALRAWQSYREEIA